MNIALNGLLTICFDYINYIPFITEYKVVLRFNES